MNNLTVSPQRIRRGLLATAVTVLVASAPALAADPAVDRILQLDRYTSEKGRALGLKYQVALRDVNVRLYNCMPWLEVKKEGLGFFKPRHLDGDTRYFSVNVDVDQRPTPEFVRLSSEDRASSMFSRYVPHILRTMARSELLAEPQLEGFTVILSWLKREPGEKERPVFDTIAAFMPKTVAGDFVAGRSTVAQLVAASHVIAWDGETKLGPVRLRAWPDDFVLTYRVAGYTPDPKVACR